MKHTVVGVDSAKRLFQLYWVERETAEIENVSLKREKFLEHFANRAPCLIGMEAGGGSQHWARQLQGLGHEAKLVARQAGEAVRGRQQERCGGRTGDLDRHATAGDQDGGGQERSATSCVGAASHAPTTGEVSHGSDQWAAWAPRRVWRSDASRARRGSGKGS